VRSLPRLSLELKSLSTISKLGCSISSLLLPSPAASKVSEILPWSEDFENYLRDESKLTGTSAKGISFPKTIDELSGVVAMANSTHKKLTISASRTGLTGGAVPDPQSIVLSTERLKGIVLNSDKKELSVLSGTTLQEIDDFIADLLPDYYFPVDPTERSASIGGAIALNAGGARSFHYGSIRSWVSGLTVILSTGEILSLRRGEVRANSGEFSIELGCESKTFKAARIPKPETKNTLGYSFEPELDLIDLFIGSEGTLGVIAEANLKLEQVPKVHLSHYQGFSSEAVALAAVKEIRERLKNYTLSIEFIDSRSLKRVAETPKPQFAKFLSLSPNSALFIEAGLGDDDQVLEFSEILFEILMTLGEDPSVSVSGTDSRTLLEIKSFRHAVPERMNSIIAERRKEFPALHKLSTDMAVTDQDLHWVYNLYEERLSKEGFDFCIFGHAGNNHFHVNILPRSPEELIRAKEAYRLLAKEIVARGGAVAAEHGIGRLKQPFLKEQYSPEILATFKALKALLDPKQILNPGVLID